jgi:hypothetical protein
LTWGTRGYRIALAALAVCIVSGAGQAAAATFPVGGVYAGQTSQKEVITLVSNPARSRVVSISWGWFANCVAGPAATPTTELQTSWTEFRGGYPINSRTNRWNRSFTATTSDTGVARTFRYRLRGTRVPTGIMKGTLIVTLTETAIDGRVVRTCDSGPVRFTIAERHVFGGGTSQDELMSATFNAPRTQIRRLEWNWTATCVKGPRARPETRDSTFWRDFLTKVPLDANARFAGKLMFDPEIDSTTGIARRFSYNVSLTRTGQVLRGFVSAQFVEYDASNGNTSFTPSTAIRTCASGKVTLVNVRD